MRTKVLAICLLLILTFVSVGFVATTKADVGEGEWFISYTVEDPNTGELLVDVDFEADEERILGSIFGGSELEITFTVDVGVTSPNTLLKLKTAMAHSNLEDTYWELVSQEYELTAYNPNSQDVQFYQVKGELTMKLYGRVPQNIAQEIPVDYRVVTLYGPAGETLDLIEVKVVTAETSEYETLFSEKEDELLSLKESGVDPGYLELYENILNESRVQADDGYVEAAIGMLNTLDVDDVPAYSTVEGLFLPVVGALVAIVVVLGIMFLRGRGKIQYVTMVLEDQIRDLEGLTLRASRVDRTISTSLESVKDRLKSIVGM
ncbi:hypothetical protein JW988_00935 [Candidatus Bathyarchaeota archaeon]|nr:hypothetical protein [Candidatus Bathyarchaeota archaeon]